MLCVKSWGASWTRDTEWAHADDPFTVISWVCVELSEEVFGTAYETEIQKLYE